MRVVVTGATGNVGTSLVAALADDAEVESIAGLARRLPDWQPAKTTWVVADVAADDLTAHFRHADVVVHLAWLIQPSRQEAVMARTNVEGSRRVFEAAGAAGVKALVYASSVGAYSAGPKDRAVDETWPTEGIPSSPYSRHKADVERLLDRFESEHPGVRVVRLRPALIFKSEAGSEVRRLFLGPLFPNPLVRRGLIPLVPGIDGLRFQAVHSYDVAEAYRLAVVRPVSGAFNVAAPPVLDPDVLARVLGARKARIGRSAARSAFAAAWRLRLVPADPGWMDMALGAPILDTARAEQELGWRPHRSSIDAVEDLLAGLRGGDGFPTPPLARGGDGILRWRELASAVGQR